jgi:arsenate reductase
MEIVIYGLRSEAVMSGIEQLLVDNGVDLKWLRYHEDPLDEADLRRLLAKADVLDPREVLRRREPLWSSLALDDRRRSTDDLFRLMAEYPPIVQHPIVECGDRAVFARSPRRVLSVL